MSRFGFTLLRRTVSACMVGLMIGLFVLLMQEASAQKKNFSSRLMSSSKADTWVGVDQLGRQLPTHEETGDFKKDKFVGIFYFVWHGAHGYDQYTGELDQNEVLPKLPSDTVSPYDISKLVAQHPDNPQYGPLLSFHYWAEPYFGYYLPNDEWVIRKHAQMLSDAGVDVIIIDATNESIYLSQVTKVAAVFSELRSKGISTPAIAYMVNSHPTERVKQLYDQVYKKGLYSDLWFYWKGKPLLLAPPEAISEEMSGFFTVRQSWAWTHSDGWFADGKDKWPWLDHTPQHYGWSESPEKPEQVSVSIAQHPLSNIGRSFHDGHEPATPSPGEGLNFKQQWENALKIDPEFIFITGWNEWVAMRLLNDGSQQSTMGKPLKKGESFFFDLYNEEYSRDAEPMKGGFGDNYYYQMTNYIRLFKGTRPNPSFHKFHAVRIDGRFSDWRNVSATFLDDVGDTYHRNHPGWGRIEKYENYTGRNDIVEAKMATGQESLFFYVKTAAPLTSWQDTSWMNLHIRIEPSLGIALNGAEFLVNRKPGSAETTTLEKRQQGKWIKIADLSYRYHSNELEVEIPKEYLGILNKRDFVVDFKWTDNAPINADPIQWLDHGDAAPNARFFYRYAFRKEN